MFETRMTLRDLREVCHRDDPDTSWVAAQLAHSGSKVGDLCTAILALLDECGPMTAKETHRRYEKRRALLSWWPEADLQDIRRRMTDLKKHYRLIVDTGTRRNGEAEMGRRAD